MAQQDLEIGVAPDDGLGESLRDAALKIQANFTELYGLAGGGGPAVSVNDATAAYTLLAADAGAYRRMTDPGAKTISVQDFATEPVDVDSEWYFRNCGAGVMTFDPDAGVTINVPAGGTLDVPEGGVVTLKNVDEDEFDLLGVTVPV